MHPAFKHPVGRRQWLASAAGLGLSGRAWSNPAAPASRVSIARCDDYGPAIYPALKTMFGQLGGIAGLVKGKTVGIKVNLTGGPRNRIGNVPIERSAYTHPDVIGAAVRLIRSEERRGGQECRSRWGPDQ